MQLLARFNRIFSHEPGVARRFPGSSPRNALDELISDLRREMYSMDAPEEAAVHQIMAGIGSAVTLRRDAVVFGRNGKPRHLEKGSRLRIPGIPFRIDVDRGVQVVVLDQNDNLLSMSLSGYLRDVWAGH